MEVPRLGPLGGDIQAHGSYVAWWLRMVPHRQPRVVFKYWARTSSTPLVPCSLCSSSSSTECGTYLFAAGPAGTHSANCAGVNCSDKFQQFLVGCGRPCDQAARRSWVRGALFDSRYMFCVSKGGIWNNFWLFYVNGYTRLLRSILGINAPRAVFRAIAFTQNGEVYTVDASEEKN